VTAETPVDEQNRKTALSIRADGGTHGKKSQYRAAGRISTGRVPSLTITKSSGLREVLTPIRRSWESV